MAYEKKPLKGFLFVNKERTSDKHPTSKGYLVLSKELCEKMLRVGDFEINIAAWIDTEKGHNSISVDTWKFDNERPTNTNSTGVPSFSESVPT